MTWLLALLLSWLWAGSPLAQMWPNPGPGRAAFGGGGGGSTPLAGDGFPGGDGALSASWGSVTGNAPLVVVSTTARVQAVGGDEASRYTGVAFPNDQYAEVTIIAAASANAGGGPAVRIAAAANTFYRATIKGPLGASAVIRIEKLQAGAYASLTGNVTMTLAANDVIRLSVTTSGANAVLTATRNGTTVAGPVTDNGTVNPPVLASGAAGMAAFVDTGTTADVILDNWAGGSIP